MMDGHGRRGVMVWIIFEMLADRIVEGQLAVLRKLRDGNRRERLVDRSDVEARVDRVGARSGLIAHADRRLQDRALSVRQQDDAGKLLPRSPVGEPRS